MAKVFKKLITEEATPSLPVWNGTSLYGTTWKLKKGWTATAAYGKFAVHFTGYGAHLGLGGMRFGLYVGYSYPSLPNIDAIEPNENYAVCLKPWFKAAGELVLGPVLLWNDEDYTLTFHGGEDTGNTDLINWVKENGELTSHQMPTDSL